MYRSGYRGGPLVVAKPLGPLAEPELELEKKGGPLPKHSLKREKGE